MRTTSRSMWISALVVTAGFAVPQACGAAAARTFDILTYTPPKGFSVVEKPNEGGGRVELTKASATNYCLIAIYASTPADSDLHASFAAEWEGVALKTIEAVEAPAPTTRTVGNTRAAVGSATSTVGGQPAWARQIVLDAGASVLTIVIVSPSEQAFTAYEADVEKMLGSLVARPAKRADAPAVAAATPSVADPTPPLQTENGRLVIPAPARPITVADLVGEWGQNDGISTTYVDRYSGAYAGTDSLHFTNKWTITKKGEIYNDFFAIQNGKKITEKTAGTVTVVGPVLAIKQNNLAKYVVRGWLELPDMTILVICGPWYDDQEIPPEHFTNPDKGANLDQKWIRKK